LRDAGIWTIGGIAVLTFCITSPYVLLDAGAAWKDFSLMGRVHLLSREAATDMPSWRYYLFYSLRYGLGHVGWVLVLVALVWRPHRWRPEELVLLVGVWTFFALLMAAESVFMRYALPLAPPLAVLIVRPLLELCRSRTWLVVGCLALLGEPVYASWMTRSLLSGEDTREEVERWLDERVPPGSWVVDLPPGVGNLQVVNPWSVFARQKRFRDSFSREALIATYEWLSQQDDLPPFYVVLKPTALKEDMAFGEEEARGYAICLWYQHPVCPPAESKDAHVLLERAEWQEEFSPGGIETAVFDVVDWYFLPVAGFEGNGRTGPVIRVGKVPVKTEVQAGKARDFFQVLHAILMGNQQIAQKNWEGAFQTYSRVLQTPFPLGKILTTSYLYDFCFHFGLAHSRLGYPDPAVVYWEQAAGLKDDHPQLFNNLGVVYSQLGKVEQAIGAFEKAVEIDAHYAEAHFNMGNALFSVDRYEAALQAWQKTIELDSRHAKGYYGMGNVHYQRGDWNRATQAYQRALELDPHNGDIYFNIAQVHLEEGRLEEAIQAFEKVVELQPEDVDSYIALGDVYGRSGRRDEAVRCLGKALELAPDHPQAEAIRQVLREAQ